MSREGKKAKRAAKKAARKERSIQKKRLFEAIQNANLTFEPDGSSKEEFIDVFQDFWKILDPALKYAIAMDKTNAKTDEVLEDVWTSGDAIANGGNEDSQSKFFQNFRQIWGKLENALELLENVNDLLIKNNKVDEVLDKVLEIGDWIADGGEN
jgi:hypothetical protein